MGDTPVQQSEALQPHVLTSPLPHYPIELGQAKNPNKNPVAERAVQELETELLRQEPLGGAVSPLTLAVATSAFELSYPFTWPILARNVDTARPVFKPAVTPCRRPVNCPPARVASIQPPPQ